MNGLPTLEYRQYASSLTSQAQADAYEQALTRWKTTGYVQSGDAAILGVPAGTPTADVSYRNASLALQKWKAGYWY